MSGLLFVSIQGGPAAAWVNPYPRLIDPNWALQHARVRKASEASDDNENVPGPVTHDFNLLSAETKRTQTQDENVSRTLVRRAARVKGQSPNSHRVGETPTRRLIGRGNDRVRNRR
jgi:hypothetical protein